MAFKGAKTPSKQESGARSLIVADYLSFLFHTVYEIRVIIACSVIQLAFNFINIIISSYRWLSLTDNDIGISITALPLFALSH